MSFTITELTGHSYLVDGQDIRGFSGQQILDGHQYDELLAELDLAEAHDAFDAKVADFFSELTEAAEALASAHVPEAPDPLEYIVVQEHVEATPGQEQILRRLNPHTVILRALAEGEQDRLIWVNNELVLTKHAVTPAPASDGTGPAESEDFVQPGYAEGDAGYPQS